MSTVCERNAIEHFPEFLLYFINSSLPATCEIIVFCVYFTRPKKVTVFIASAKSLNVNRQGLGKRSRVISNILAVITAIIKLNVDIIMERAAVLAG